MRKSILAGSALGVTTIPFSDVVSAETDFASREAFDELEQIWTEGGGWKHETNDSDSSGRSGKLAWGQSYLLTAYLLMYESHGDTLYLDKLIENADVLLEKRDSARGVTDWRGKSLPAWRADHHYTVGKTALEDAAGRPTLEVRQALAYGNAATTSVSPGTEPGTFALDVYNEVYDRTTSYDNLSMDPDSPNYAPARINEEGFRWETPDRVLVTVEDLRNSPEDADKPAPGKSDHVSGHYIFPPHTGMITYPLAKFARLVYETPRLRRNSRYKDRADTYLEAAEAAVAVHDHQWRETDEGEGYYIFTPGSPARWESVDEPFNHFLALGRTIIQLAAITDEESYKEKARKMARTLKNDMRESDRSLVWNYWWTKGEVANGWSLDDPASEYRPWYPGNDYPEDISHANWDISFATLMFHNAEVFNGRAVFNGEDMNRLARTFTENVAADEDDGPTATRYVDGSGRTGLSAYERMAAGWNVLAQWDEEVFEHTRAIYNTKGDNYAPYPSTLFGVASLNYGKKITE